MSSTRSTKALEASPQGFPALFDTAEFRSRWRQLEAIGGASPGVAVPGAGRRAGAGRSLVQGHGPESEKSDGGDGEAKLGH